jgi:hypothetical protein
MAIKSKKNLKALPSSKNLPYSVYRQTRAKNRMPIVRKLEYGKFQNLKYSRKKPKKLNGNKIKEKSQGSSLFEKPSK